MWGLRATAPPLQVRVITRKDVLAVDFKTVHTTQTDAALMTAPLDDGLPLAGAGISSGTFLVGSRALSADPLMRMGKSLFRFLVPETSEPRYRPEPVPARSPTPALVPAPAVLARGHGLRAPQPAAAPAGEREEAPPLALRVPGAAM